MSVRGGNERIERELRRQDLAARLLAHQARTQTICDLTGLTRHQLATLRHRWRVADEMRHRGPSPTSFRVFFRSTQARNEAAALAVVCQVFGAIASERLANAARDYPSLKSGECLCDALEAWRVCYPRSAIEFEQALLLATGLSQGDLIALGRCEKCEATILIDRLDVERSCCSFCEASRTNGSVVEERFRRDSSVNGPAESDLATAGRGAAGRVASDP